MHTTLYAILGQRAVRAYILSERHVLPGLLNIVHHQLQLLRARDASHEFWRVRLCSCAQLGNASNLVPWVVCIAPHQPHEFTGPGYIACRFSACIALLTCRKEVRRTCTVSRVVRAAQNPQNSEIQRIAWASLIHACRILLHTSPTKVFFHPEYVLESRALRD